MCYIIVTFLVLLFLLLLLLLLLPPLLCYYLFLIFVKKIIKKKNKYIHRHHKHIQNVQANMRAYIEVYQPDFYILIEFLVVLSPSTPLAAAVFALSLSFCCCCCWL